MGLLVYSCGQASPVNSHHLLLQIDGCSGDLVVNAGSLKGIWGHRG